MADILRDLLFMAICGWFLWGGRFGFRYNTFFENVRLTEHQNKVGFYISMAFCGFIFLLSFADLIGF